ncbi:MAG: dicarboxylate/amino acid:cation symporter [Alphaproteobacteria bacterium]
MAKGSGIAGVARRRVYDLGVVGKLLSSSWVIFASLLLGLYIGFFHKDLAAAIGPFGTVYLALLKMCLLPFLISAITVSLVKLLKTHTAANSLRRIVAVFVGGLLLCTLYAVIFGAVEGPGRDLDESSRAVLGNMVDRSPYAVDLEMSLTGPTVEKKSESSTETVIRQLIPDNIFNALSSGDSLKVLFFAIIFGAAVGFSSRHVGDGLSATLDTIYHACQRVIQWVNYVLPFALCALVASQIAIVGLEPLVAMVRFIVSYAAAVILLMIVCSIIIWARGRVSYIQSVMALREAVLIAIGTRSSIACIPSVIRSMEKELGFDKTMVELVAPLSITICRFGPTLYYGVATIFVAQLYGIPLGVAEYVSIFIGSFLAGLASAGTTGILTITLLSLVFAPLGLPLEAALVLFITIDPLVDIVRTVAIVYPNCAAVAMVCGPDKEWVPPDRAKQSASQTSSAAA